MYFQSLSEFTSEKCIYSATQISELKRLLEKLFRFGNGQTDSQTNPICQQIYQPLENSHAEEILISPPISEESKLPAENYLKIIPLVHRSKPHKFKMEPNILVTIGRREADFIHHIDVPGVESNLSVFCESSKLNNILV